MPRGTPNKPRPSFSLGLVKPMGRVEDMVILLAEAVAKLTVAQTAMMQLMVERETKAHAPVPRGTALLVGRERTPTLGQFDPHDFGNSVEIAEIAIPDGIALNSVAHPGSEPILGISQDDDAPADDDPVSALYSELADYNDEDEIPPPPLEESELWGKRLDAWRGAKLWMPAWGPRPGQDGCNVPPYLMTGR